MGLGLSLAQAIVNRHKGEIELISKEGQGTTFIIRLPLAPEKPRSKAKGAKKRIRGSNILIIAEEGIVKDLTTQLLVSKGGKVTTEMRVTEIHKAKVKPALFKPPKGYTEQVIPVGGPQ